MSQDTKPVGQQGINVQSIAEKLIADLDAESGKNHLRKEGVVLLYDRIRAEIEGSNKPAGDDSAASNEPSGEAPPAQSDSPTAE